MVRASESELAILSDDTFSELVVPLKPDLYFGYEEPRGRFERDIPVECGLLVFFPRDGGEPDRIAFLGNNIVDKMDHRS